MAWVLFACASIVIFVITPSFASSSYPLFTPTLSQAAACTLNTSTIPSVLFNSELKLTLPLHRRCAGPARGVLPRNWRTLVVQQGHRLQ